MTKIASGVFSPSLRAQSQDIWLSGGVRLDCDTAGHIGHKFQYADNRTNFIDNTGLILPAVGSAGMANRQFGYNFLYYPRAREKSKIRTFATAGFHVSDFALPEQAVVSDSSVRPGGNAGAGKKIRRGDSVSQTEIAAGFGVYFG